MGDGAARAFWDAKILAWEDARYSLRAWANPLAWSVRARMRAASALVAGELRDCRSILDLGCGSGRLALALDPGRSYVGVDFSSEAIAAARARFAPSAPRVRFECRDVLEALEEKADLAVFLGLTDWLASAEVERLFAGLKTGRLLFSFTEERSAFRGLYGAYRKRADGAIRARSWREAEIVSALERGRCRAVRVIRSFGMGPGRLVLAERK